ncbi:MAG: HlyD family type I secretion periplasmic adaptor subunit [Geminicoccaceae bacterium]
MVGARVEMPPSLGLPTRRFNYPSHKTFLSQAALLEEAGPPQVPAYACFLGMAFVFFAILASIMIEIDVTSSSPGRITSAGSNYILQSFEGGLVDQIHAEEGEVVDAGATLLTLNDPEANAALDRLTARKVTLDVQVEKLRKLAGLPPNPAPNDVQEHDPRRLGQMAILPLTETAIAAEYKLVEAEIAHKLEVLQRLRNLEEKAELTLGLANQKLATQRHLHALELATKTIQLEAERDAADAQFDLTSVEGQIKEARASLLESRKRLDDVVAARGERLGDQLSAILLDKSEIDQQIIATQKRIERSVVKAPARGIVHELSVAHPGQTVVPGDKLVELVPMDANLIVEMRLPTTEISHVHMGQPVRITIDGVEPHRHGFLRGEVATLSPSTFVDEDGLPYYRASVTLQTTDLAGMSLVPGMTVQAQVKTDQRTMLEYMLKPVYRAWETAFRER